MCFTLFLIQQCHLNEFIKLIYCLNQYWLFSFSTLDASFNHLKWYRGFGICFVKVASSFIENISWYFDMFYYLMQWYSHILMHDVRVLILLGFTVYLIKMPSYHSNTSSKMGFTLIEYHQYSFDFSHFQGVWYVYRLQCECSFHQQL